MTTIRTLAGQGLADFLALEPDPERAAAQAAYVDNLITLGAMRAEWCYLAEERGRPIGRMALWTLPKVGRPMSVVLLDVRRDVTADDARAWVAVSLLERAVADALAADAPEFGHVLDEPEQWPQWQANPAERSRWLEAAGFRVVRATSRWSFDGPPPPVPERLTFRSIEAVGEPAFLDALERVSSTTLDQRIEADRAQLGSAGEARQTLEWLRDMEAEPGWWELAFDATGSLVGLVTPARAPSMTTIGYIGVVPEQRGHGYVDDLLARGTAVLRRSVPDMTVRADTDLANTPMAAAFERGGYARFGTRREFELPMPAR